MAAAITMQEYKRKTEQLREVQDHLTKAVEGLHRIANAAIEQEEYGILQPYFTYITAVNDCVSFTFQMQQRLFDEMQQRMQREITATTEAVQTIRKWQRKAHLSK